MTVYRPTFLILTLVTDQIWKIRRWHINTFENVAFDQALKNDRIKGQNRKFQDLSKGLLSPTNMMDYVKPSISTAQAKTMTSSNPHQLCVTGPGSLVALYRRRTN